MLGDEEVVELSRCAFGCWIITKTDSFELLSWERDVGYMSTKKRVNRRVDWCTGFGGQEKLMELENSYINQFAETSLSLKCLPHQCATRDD